MPYLWIYIIKKEVIFERLTELRFVEFPSNKNTQESAGQQRDPWARVII